MIVFDLVCAHAHVFEAWFASGPAFEAQAAAGQVACPICGDTAVTKAPMAPAVGAKANAAPAMTPDAVKAGLRELAAMQARVLKGSRWVGPAFAAQAREMHDGVRDHAPIHGQATLAEARDLAADGVAVAPLPFPVAPPETLN